MTRDALKQFGLRAISGEDRSPPAALARLATAAVEPGYASAMRLRNRLFDWGVQRTHHLGRPAISVGNLTTGGTGKTPVVEWLARQLLASARRPAVLLRGYGGTAADDGDEARVLRRALGDTVPVRANPSRVDGAAAVLRDRPDVDVFLLDDAFQHRRAARAFDLVLVSATNPFGFDHVLPRGLLREPPSGLRRATAVLLTRCDAVGESELVGIESRVRRWNPCVPIFRAEHAHAAIWDPVSNSASPIATLSTEPFFAVAAIGDPNALHTQLQKYGRPYVGHRWFADHHAYTAADLREIRVAAGAARIVTTEKDWVKLSEVAGTSDATVGILQLSVRFRADDADQLAARVLAAI